MEVESGHVAVENTGIVFEVTAVETAASVSNAGYIAANTSGATIDGKAAGGDYEINSLERLEGFRDAVNAGNNFAGLTVKLTQDISLRDGWQPIGEGYRDVAETNTAAYGITTFFAGTFDGQNHTISNLNNKGFEPTKERLVTDGVDTYSYGLFALVENATFRNIKFSGVSFKGSEYAKANADSVGALVGYSRGNLTVDNVTVSGSLVGTDAISGVVGRVRVDGNTVSITNCTNNASIEADVAASGIARIYKGTAGHSVVLTGNRNFGTITTSYKWPLKAGISVINKQINLTQSGNYNGDVECTYTAADVGGGNAIL